MTDPTIRMARAEDEAALLVLTKELGYEAIDPMAFRRSFLAVVDRPDSTLLVAERAGKVVGFLSASWHPRLGLAGPQVEIDELDVAAAERGKGTGRALVDALKAHAMLLDARRVQLVTSRNLDSYRSRFYEKCGFTQVDSAVMRLPERVNL
jgi:N-acetylglutamate synthase-like GNAT family acetyltransferase